MVHSIFLNLLEESTMKHTPGSPEENSEQPFNGDEEESGFMNSGADGALVPLVSRGRK